MSTRRLATWSTWTSRKPGRIPDGGGHRVHGRAKGNRVKGSAKPGMACVHNAVDDHSRLAYSEVLPEEKKETTAAFGSAPMPTSPNAASPSNAS